jgi:two-component system, NarL family, response regulator YdfI
MTRLLLVTGSPRTRSWFDALPSRASGLLLIGITTLDALTMRMHELDPDVVLIDATDGESESVIASLETIGSAGVDVILLADRERLPVTPGDFVRVGVRAVLSPQPTLDELESALRAVSAGLVVLDPGALDGFTQRAGAIQTTSALGVSDQPLTPREIDVLNALAEGLGNKQIAARLDISEHTVKTHLSAIFEKLETSNRTEAVMAGARLGLLLL